MVGLLGADELCLSLVKVEKILDLPRCHHGVVICSFCLWHDHSVVFLIKMGTHHSYSGVFSSGQTKIKTGDDLGKKKLLILFVSWSLKVFGSFFWFVLFFKKSLSAAGYSEHSLEILCVFSKRNTL